MENDVLTLPAHETNTYPLHMIADIAKTLEGLSEDTIKRLALELRPDDTLRSAHERITKRAAQTDTGRVKTA